MQVKNPTIALIVAAGSSSRMGAQVPKPYLQVAGKAVLSHVLQVFASHPGIDGVRVVINRAHHPLYRQAAKGFTVFPPVVGGKTRQDSVRIGLEAIARANPARVLIHDAARPLVSAEVIDRVLAGLETHAAVLPCQPLSDSIHQQTPSRLQALERSELISAQTPQGFDFRTIRQAHAQFAHQDVTDDIALAQLAGCDILCVDGAPENMKLTHPHHFLWMQSMLADTTASSPLSPRETRTGLGFDVHAWTEHPANTVQSERLISLCGMRIAHSHKLLGHSDADVALHALVDALLGAAALGDIGQHFPPSDAKWKGADSRIFLSHTLQLLAKQSAIITHVDITIIGEQPKISPHREAMRQQLASLLQLDVQRVSVKATTTEKLGFLGRGEGLAAQAIATLTLPGMP